MEAPLFTQIVAKLQSWLPLDDLRADGSYERLPIIPDDLPPTLSLPWAMGPHQPRLNRCQDDGALNVWVENPSGGGAGHLARKIAQPQVLNQLPLSPIGNGFITWTSLSRGDEWIYGLSVAMVVTGTGTSLAGFGVVEWGYTNPNDINPKRLPVFTLVAAASGGGAQIAQQTVSLAQPVSIFDTWGVNADAIYVYSDNVDGCTARAALTAWVGTPDID